MILMIDGISIDIMMHDRGSSRCREMMGFSKSSLHDRSMRDDCITDNSDRSYHLERILAHTKRHASDREIDGKRGTGLQMRIGSEDEYAGIHIIQRRSRSWKGPSLLRRGMVRTWQEEVTARAL